MADDRIVRPAGALNRRGAIALLLAVQLVVGFALCEGLLQAMYHYPRAWYPLAIRNYLGVEYIYRRHIVQLDERFARYDPQLLYTLRPGRFTFDNVEFSTPFEVNSLGVRDDEASLAQPEIIVAGDSFAMGWGVRQDEDFPALIEQRTGRRVLNTAVSSYGTVREMLMVDRTDLSRATTLIIQYCDNDFPENEEFEKHGNHHVASPRQAWLDAANLPRRSPRYWPFPMVYTAATWVKRGIEKRSQGGFAPIDAPPREAARLFLNALMHAPSKDLSGLRIVVTDMDPNPAFIRALAQLHTAADYPDYIRRMIVVDVSAQLTPAVHYLLDDHLRPSGHAAIADALIAALATR